MSTNLIGQILLNQFRVDAFVASGGMGAVYRVWDLKRNVPLAMKVLHAELAEDEAVFRKFQREGRALQNLRHPNIVPFYGLYQTRDFAFLVEHFVDGATLKQILNQRPERRVPVKEALVVLKVLSAALGYAHAEGVVHCDVKPGNLLVDQSGNLFLGDFGIARYAESTTTTLATIGTAAYMAPEQIRGGAVSPATDVYATGVVLFELLTGQRPFKGNEAGTDSAGGTANERIRYAHLRLQPPDPRGLNPSIPEALSQVILRALEKSPSQRYNSMHELFAAACAAAGVNPAQVPNRIVPPLQTWSSSDAKGERAPQPKPLERSAAGSRSSTLRQVFPWLAGATGIFLLGGLAIVILLGVILVTRGTTGPLQSLSGGINGIEALPGGATYANPSPSDTPRLSTPVQPDPGLLAIAAEQTVQAHLTALAFQLTDTPPQPPTQLPALPPTDTPPPQPAGEPRIAYVLGHVTEDSDADIYLADLDGNGAYCIVCTPCFEAEPAWSPDERFIVYQRKCQGESSEIWKVSVNGTDTEQLTFTPGFDKREPHFSPDGSQIVYRVTPSGTSRDANGTFWVMDKNGNAPHPLAVEGRSPVWSPDGRWLAYMFKSNATWQIFAYDLSSNSNKKLTDCTFNCRWPEWSPDSRYVIYNSTPSATSTDPDKIWYVPVGGGNPILLVDNGALGRPSWSESGWIAFNSADGIERIRSDSSQRTILIRDPFAWAPVWSR